jgi:hypothetical protein
MPRTDMGGHDIAADRHTSRKSFTAMFCFDFGKVITSMGQAGALLADALGYKSGDRWFDSR